MTLTKEHPDFDAARRRAWDWAIASGWLRPTQIVEAVEAGEAGLRNERIRDQVRAEEEAG